jgi:hypothetical protein
MRVQNPWEDVKIRGKTRKFVLKGFEKAELCSTHAPIEPDVADVAAVVDAAAVRSMSRCVLGGGYRGDGALVRLAGRPSRVSQGLLHQPA